jgi:Domain of unknown function (DUF4265)
MPETIELLVDDQMSVADAVIEKVEAERLSPSEFRLLYSPGLVEGLAAGDVVEVLGSRRGAFRLVGRGGNVCVWFYFPTRADNRGPNAQRLADAVRAAGGRVDGGGVYSLVLTFPSTMGIKKIATMIDEYSAQVPDSEWMFGNVFDPRDGTTPLSWWPPERD